MTVILSFLLPFRNQDFESNRWGPLMRTFNGVRFRELGAVCKQICRKLIPCLVFLKSVVYVCAREVVHMELETRYEYDSNLEWRNLRIVKGKLTLEVGVLVARLSIARRWHQPYVLLPSMLNQFLI